MGNKIIALEYEADGVVSVSIPIAILVHGGGFAVDQQISRGIAIKSADDIEHRGLATARRTKNCKELSLPYRQTDIIENNLIWEVLCHIRDLDNVI